MEDEIRIPQARVGHLLVFLGFLAYFWATWLVYKLIPLHVTVLRRDSLIWLTILGTACTLTLCGHVLARLGTDLVLDDAGVRVERRGRTKWELSWADYGGYAALKNPASSIVVSAKILDQSGRVRGSVKVSSGLFLDPETLDEGIRTLSELNRRSPYGGPNPSKPSAPLSTAARALLRGLWFVGLASLLFGMFNFITAQTVLPTIAVVAIGGVGALLLTLSSLVQYRQ